MSVDVTIRATITIEPAFDRHVEITIDASDSALEELISGCFGELSARAQNYTAAKLARATDYDNTETIISELFDDLPWERQVAIVRNLNASVQVFHEDPNDV